MNFAEYFELAPVISPIVDEFGRPIIQPGKRIGDPISLPVPARKPSAAKAEPTE